MACMRAGMAADANRRQRLRLSWRACTNQEQGQINLNMVIGWPAGLFADALHLPRR